MVAPYAVTPESVQQYRQGILGSLGRMREGYDKSQLTPEQRAVIEKEERDRLAQEYADYTKGRGERMEKIRSSLEGKKPDFLSGIVSGLPSGAGLPGGPRVADVLAGAAKGLAGQQSEYEKRKREAAKYMAEADELAARADLAEKRGQTAAGRQLSAAEDLRRKQAYELLGVSESAYRQGVGALMSDEQAEQQKQLSMAMGAAGADITARQQEKLKAMELAKPTALQERLALFKSNPELFAKLFGDKDKIPSAVQTQIVKDIAQKYSDPHDPRVIAAVERENPNAAKILRLKPNEAKNQPDYPAVLRLVDQIKYQEIMANIGQPQSYTTLPSPSSK